MFLDEDEKTQLNGLTIYQKVLTVQSMGVDTKVPWEVWRCFGHQQKIISIAGTDVCLGEDYVSLEQARKALEWYVEELGGKVNWQKND